MFLNNKNKARLKQRKKYRLLCTNLYLYEVVSNLFIEEDFHVKEVVSQIQKKFVRFDSFDTEYYPQFDAVVASKGFDYIVEKRKGIIIGSALKTERTTSLETLIVTWHGLERADTFWDQVKEKMYPEFGTRRCSSLVDYIEYSGRALGLLEDKYSEMIKKYNSKDVNSRSIPTEYI